MEEQSLEDAGPDLKAEESKVSEAADVLDGDGPGESCEAEVKVEETEQAATEEDEVAGHNAAEKPEEEIGVSVMDDLPVSGDFEEGDAADVEIFQDENEEDQPESQVDEDQPESQVDEDQPESQVDEDQPESQVDEDQPESQVDEDHSQCTADLQNTLSVDSEEERKLLQELQTEHEKLSQLNHQLQTKLAEYFWLKSAEELQSVQEKISSAESGTEKYQDLLEDIHRQRQDNKQRYLEHQHVDDLQRQNKEKLEEIERAWSAQVSAKRKVLVTNLEQLIGKLEAQAEAERLLRAAQKSEEEFLSVRQENFKLNLKLSKLNAGLHVRDEDQHGKMHQIDFEQLRIEKQSYSEKIQECTEDLLKLKKMLPHIGQILMHVKEKLRFVQVENQEKRWRFEELDALVLREQKALMQTMQARDTLRFDNLQKRQDRGLLGNPTLLRDLEDTEDEREALEIQVEKLKRHAGPRRNTQA